MIPHSPHSPQVSHPPAQGRDGHCSAELPPTSACCGVLPEATSVLCQGLSCRQWDRGHGQLAGSILLSLESHCRVCLRPACQLQPLLYVVVVPGQRPAPQTQEASQGPQRHRPRPAPPTPSVALRLFARLYLARLWHVFSFCAHHGTPPSSGAVVRKLREEKATQSCVHPLAGCPRDVPSLMLTPFCLVSSTSRQCCS